MFDSIILAELARNRHQELLKEAESWRLGSQEMEKKPDKTGMIRRIMADLAKRRKKYSQKHDLHFPRFSDENVR